ncbi:MAG: type III pantothenate kinase [Bacteroidales bacterium]|nr:type III pantothenate kinase [Bacteroidales bacterium]
MLCIFAAEIYYICKVVNFLIDLGNTNCKVAFEEEGVLDEIYRSTHGEDIPSFIFSHLGDREVDVIVFSNVREENAELNAMLEKRCRKFVLLDYLTELPVDLNYQFPAKGLGADRIAGALAVAMMFPGKECIKFDFGTALTVDFINKEGTLVGGNISLGLTSRFRALNTFTKRLPLIKPVEDFPEIGVNTDTAMTAGVVLGLIFEVKGYIEKNPESTIVFTGGDAFYFAKKMKSAIFVAPNLVLMGLAQIADYYAQKQN